MPFSNAEREIILLAIHRLRKKRVKTERTSQSERNRLNQQNRKENIKAGSR